MAQIGEQLDTLPSLIRTCVACKKRLDRNFFCYITTIKRGVDNVSIKILGRQTLTRKNFLIN